MKATTIVYFDLETGGTDVKRHPIIQVGAAAVRDGDIVSTFERKLQFDPAQCDPEALVINGYSEERWKEAVPSGTAANDFRKFLQKHSCIPKESKSGKKYKVAKLGGYNIIPFDMPFLQEWFKDHEIFLPADYRCLDVLQLACWFFQMCPSRVAPERMKLGSMCEYFGVKLENAHDAIADCVATAELAEAIGNVLIDEVIDLYMPL